MRTVAGGVSEDTYLRGGPVTVNVGAQSTQWAGCGGFGQTKQTMKRSLIGARQSGSVALAVLGAVTLAPGAARAVVVYGGSTSANFQAPADDPGWANVGKVNGSSGVYLGNVSIPGHGSGYWVLTANHVGAGAINLGGTSYSAVAGSSYRLTNPDNSLTDLLLYKISSNPGLPTLKVASGAPALGSSLTMVGYGYTGAASQTTWDINGVIRHPEFWNSWTETTTPSGLYSVGYTYGTSGTENWGVNTLEISTKSVVSGSSKTDVFGS